ncbi:potassium channel family protein [Halomicroarcula sp. F28]|uniref:potassium channel family protein n=1 Tax=Haloarcula salinisoli TaxID=2487746 RepID=UPI001C73C960|nr:potassium channel family protein [Halomicroarcula salinisoli]MBX0287224.1 potassium channel family protein [Halomicroarcula salinisoli]
MNPLPFIVGLFLLCLAIADLLWTTLWVEGGAGPLTASAMRWTWRGVRLVGRRRRSLLTVAGPVVLLLSITLWLGLLWAGWTLVFAGLEDAITDTLGPGPISWTERLYFVGYSLFTLGNGDFAPRDGLPQMLTVLTTASGMLFITLIVSYVISVLDAVTQKRALASSVSSLGQHGEAIVRTAWDGADCAALELPLASITSDINELTTNHQAYPILHYFYTDDPTFATVRSIAVLDDALTILQFGTPAPHRPAAAVVQSAHRSIGTYLETVGSSFGHSADTAPDVPDLSTLREAGVPTVEDGRFRRSVDDVAARRKQLGGLLEADAREWPVADE